MKPLTSHNVNKIKKQETVANRNHFLHPYHLYSYRRICLVVWKSESAYNPRMVKKGTITSVLRHPANMKNTVSCSATCSSHVNYHVKETNMATVWTWSNQAAHEYSNMLTTVKVSSREHEWENMISYCVFPHPQWIRLQHVPNSRPHASYWHHCIP